MAIDEQHLDQLLDDIFVANVRIVSYHSFDRFLAHPVNAGWIAPRIQGELCGEEYYLERILEFNQVYGDYARVNIGEFRTAKNGYLITPQFLMLEFRELHSELMQKLVGLGNSYKLKGASYPVSSRISSDNRWLSLIRRNYEHYPDSFFMFEESPPEIKTYAQFITGIPDFLLPLLKAYIMESARQKEAKEELSIESLN